MMKPLSTQLADLSARAKKAEAKLKEQKPAPSPQPKTAKATPPSDVEEIVLKANGMPEDLLSELKAVAAVRKVSLIEAQNDPLFKGIKDQFDRTQKEKQASLGASRSSGQTKPKKSFDTPNLSREEHQAMFNQDL